jgi:hypothetical protein
MTEVTLNSKVELRDCTPYQAAPIDKSIYGKLEKLQLATGGILARGADGILRYRTGSGPSLCVLPANIKFDHNASYSVSALEDLTLLHAFLVPPGSGVVPVTQINKGTTLYFVAEPNLELAEFLRAKRASDVPGWQSFLTRYPTSPHLAEAKQSLAALYVEAGETAQHAYLRSQDAGAASYSDLKSAKTRADLARRSAPGLDSISRLDRNIRASLTAIVDQGRSELTLYRAALTGHTSGYLHLLNAKKFSETASGIDPDFASARALQQDMLQEENTLEAQVQSAVSAQNAKQFDQAFNYVLPYRAFAQEESRIAAVIDADYGFHMDRGNLMERQSDWQGAIQEFTKAAAVKDLTEATDALKYAQQQKVDTEDKAAAAKAIETSKGYVAQHSIVRAYEVLAGLPPAQLALVTSEMKQLEPAYITSASAEAKSLRQAHDPIRGLADEIEIEKAYSLLLNAYTLSQNEAYRDRMDLLGNELSAYLLEQAKHYLAKPGGSGTELGWTYLSEAQQFKAANLDAVRDTMEAAKATHSLRSKLSIRVQFRDQTSSRDSAGYAGQLENGIISGLQQFTVPVKIVRAGETTPVDPDFQLVGNVIKHHCPVEPSIETPESEYLFGQRDVLSEAWTKQNHILEKAQMDLDSASKELQGAETRGKKGEIEDLKKVEETAKKAVVQAHDKLDATQKTVPEPIYHTYFYTKKTFNVRPEIALQFYIEDPLNAMIGSEVPLSTEDPKKFVLLEGVNAEDSKGVKPIGTAPDTAQIMSALEGTSLDSLVLAVRKKVEDLPKILFQNASSSEAAGAMDVAGELYLRFLEVTSGQSDERDRARHFLAEQFNMEPAASLNR